ncbi:MAG TPA: VTT domain-containing protein [Thiobacillus sp.]
MTSLLQNVVDWVGMHPDVAGVLVFTVAMAESLAVVGLVVPGAAVMIIAGALVALGALDFWPTLLLAVAGAIAGDGISFWIGRRYRDRLRALWPFRRHPGWLSRGEEFFHRHGGKSVLLGRFVGPVRPIVPVVAGMLGMRPATFYAVNVLSALAWAPAYLLPGMAFGASLALAGAVAARLAVLLVLLVAVIWFILWIMRWLFQVLPPRAAQMTQWLLAWGSRHPRVNNVIGGVLDPAQPEAKALLVLGTLLTGSAWLFLGVLEDVVTGDPLVRADESLYRLLQRLRTPWGDQVMVFLTELGDGVVIALVAAAVLAWLLWRRCWRAAAYWAAAVGFGQFATTVLKVVLQRPRPLTAQYDALSAYAFPSGHATMSMVTYGFLAVLVARNLSPPRRWFPYALAALLISTIALSRLYLGAHWLSDVLGGLSLGLAWVCLLAIAYYRHRAPTLLPTGLPHVTLLAFVLAAGWHVTFQYSTDFQRYAAPQIAARHLDLESWWRGQWRSLPAYRLDLEGEFEQPLNVQWAGTLTPVREKLAAQGWRESVPLSATSALRWLLPAPALAELPMLPQVHDGRHELLVMIRPLDAGGPQGKTTVDRQLVLRLWSTDVVVDPGGIPLWVGSVSFQGPGRLPFLSLPSIADGYDTPLALLERSLDGSGWRMVQRMPAPGTTEEKYRWSGSVLLVRNY